MPLHLLLEGGHLGLQIFDGRHQVGRALEDLGGAAQHVALGHGAVHRALAGFGLDPADACGHGTLRGDAEQTDLAGGLDVGAPAQFDARPEPDHADRVPVLLPEEHHGPSGLGLLERNVAPLIEGAVLAHGRIHLLLDLEEILGRQLLEMAEIEAQGGVLDEGALLLDVGPQDVPKGLVQEVGGRVVQGGFPSLVGVDPRCEPGGRIGWKPV